MTIDQALPGLDQPTQTPPKSGPHPSRPIPDWLADHIATTTGVDPRTGFTRNAKPWPCTSCGNWTLRGLDDDTAAYHATIDPTPLTEAGAALAILTGHRIWHLARFGGNLRIYKNTSYRRHLDRIDRCAEHTCTPTSFPTRPSNLTRHQAATGLFTPGTPAPF